MRLRDKPGERSEADNNPAIAAEPGVRACRVRWRWRITGVDTGFSARLFSIGEDFWIENEQGEQVYKVDGRAFSLRETFVIQDNNDAELLTIEAKLLAVRPTMKILREGKLYATVTKKLLTFLHQHYTIQIEGGATYEAEGNITSHEYEVKSGGAAVAHISKDWFSIEDSYGVAVAPGQDPVFILASAICIDEIAEEQSEHH